MSRLINEVSLLYNVFLSFYSILMLKALLKTIVSMLPKSSSLTLLSPSFCETTQRRLRAPKNQSTIQLRRKKGADLLQIMRCSGVFIGEHKAMQTVHRYLYAVV